MKYGRDIDVANTSWGSYLLVREAALAVVPAAERLWHAVFAQTHQGIAVLDREGLLVSANEAFRLVLGLAGNRELAWRSPWGEFLRLLELGSCPEQGQQAEVRWQGPEGEQRVVRFLFVPVRDSKGEVEAVVAAAQDVTADLQRQEQLRQQVREIEALRDVLVETLAMLAEWRDPGIRDHVRRVRTYTKLLLEELGAAGVREAACSDYRRHVVRSAVLHDVGKIAVPEGILFKPARLTPEEYSVVRMHTVVGARLLEEAGRALATRVGQESDFLRVAVEIARWHHERWDGTGYPDGLKGEETPLHARVVGLVDVYDALTTRRVYKEAWVHEEAVEEIRKGRGTQFDPVLVDVFVAAAERFARARQELALRGGTSGTRNASE